MDQKYTGRRYSDDACQYSIFVSYAHQDDKATGRWITTFRKEFGDLLSGNLGRIRPKPLHLSEENGPIAGGLNAELRKRILASFSMIIVVGKNYPSSDWCMQELKFFKEIFGDAGFSKRLYVLALSRASMNQVKSNPDWQRLAPPDLIWIECFSDDHEARPVRPYLQNAALSGEFLEILAKIVDHLVPAIEESIDARSSAPTTDSALVMQDDEATNEEVGAVSGGDVRAQSTLIVEERGLESGSPLDIATQQSRTQRGVRIYIETNPDEREEWKPLGRRIARLWRDLTVEQSISPPMRIRIKGLPVDMISSAEHRLDDADGVVLLWGQRDERSLASSIDKLEDILAPDDVIAPGIVACLTPPQTSDMRPAALGWTVVRFKNVRPEMLEDEMEAERLRGFLQQILEKRVGSETLNRQ